MEEQTRLRGWLVAKNLNINCLGKYQDLGFVYQYDDRLHKFPQDEVFLSDGERISFLDGYIYNKEAFICPEGYHDWQRSFALSLGKDVAAHLEKMRGAFCGYSYERETGDVIIYTDQVSNKALYYYVEGDKWMISNYVALIVRVLRANRITCHFNPTAARYMLTYGYMLDDSTFVTQIRRLLPGHYGKISDGRVRLFKYYEIPCDEEQMSEKEAVEQIDSAFRQAIVREFTKDREYGYRHLVDLSGGLDSRMVTWAAHELGFREQVNIAYSRLDYLDQKISAQVAMALKHEYLYKAMDDLTWMYDVDEMTCKNNGAAVCLGMTGGNRLLRMLDKETFGIEHTGMVGDAIVSTFYHDKNLNDQSPVFGLNQYSNFLRYSFDEKILTQYKKQEIFAVVTRGLLGAQSSYMIRQNYLETGSPFLDVDFLAAVMAVPFAYRKNHHIYLKWIADRYPAAADFIWEKWGVKPRESEIFKRKIKTTGKLAAGYLQKVSHKPSRSSMNPMDYWYQNDMDVRKYVETMYKERIADDSLPEDLRHDMKLLFTAGNFTEKTQVLTVLSAMYLFC
ncbi:MAG: hypothetical protein HFI62_05115 [Lachnospiraceae bacterium]|nr:hypothetical protein [Lachnospiraceae bacterium]